MNRRKRTQLAVEITATVVGGVYLLPMVWTVIASVTPESALLEQPLKWIPAELDLSRYVAILTPGGVGETGAGFLESMGNSLFVAIITVTIALVVSIFGAYAFARLKFAGPPRVIA